MSSNLGSARDWAQLEWRYTPFRTPLAVAIGGVVAVAFSHVLIPLLPERAIQFMMRGFRLHDLTAVLLLNDFMGVYLPTYFLGLAMSLSIVLTAREEHRLEILLAKPIRPAQFVMVRALPMLVSSLFVGVTISVACAVAIALQANAGASVGPFGALGGGLALTGVAMVFVSALQIPFTRIRDPFQGLLVASFLFLMSAMPAAVLLYRPDVFDGHEKILNTFVMTTLVWHDDTMAWLGPILLAIAIPMSALFVRAAGALLERSEGV